MTELTLNEWKEKAIKLFGEDKKNWKFKCVNCGETQTLQEFIDNNVENPEGKFYFSCIGRYVKNRGCDWTLGGLFRRHETEVIADDGDKIPVFEFANA